MKTAYYVFGMLNAACFWMNSGILVYLVTLGINIVTPQMFITHGALAVLNYFAFKMCKDRYEQMP